MLLFFFKSRKERKYVFQLDRTLNSSFIVKKENLTACCKHTANCSSVRATFFLWEMGNFTGCTNRLIKQSICIKDIYSILKPSI